jgi:hypothetical protein
MATFSRAMRSPSVVARGLVVCVVASCASTSPAPCPPQEATFEEEVAPAEQTLPPEWVEPEIYPARVAACDVLAGTGCEERCVRIFTTMSAEAAQRSLDCMIETRDEGLGCGDPCNAETCTLAAFDGPPEREADPRCDTDVVLLLRDPRGRGELYRDTCRDWTRHMTDLGRDRYVACSAATSVRGIGQRYCLWDPWVAPCGIEGKSDAASHFERRDEREPGDFERQREEQDYLEGEDADE